MTEVAINWLRNVESSYELGNNRGTVYVGECPFDVDKHNKEDCDMLWKRPWVINHPDTKDKLWRITGLESYAMQWIRQGQLIGIRVEEWDKDE